MQSIKDILGEGQGVVELIQQCGDDHSIVMAARVSHSQDRQPSTSERDEKLLRFLLEHKHTSPFEHNLFTFRITLPMAIGEQWLRHRIGWSYNKESGRYIDMRNRKMEFYTPTPRKQSGSNRQASEELAEGEHIDTRTHVGTIHAQAEYAYHKLLEMGVAKEQARLVLPASLMMTMYATCNLNSLMHFLNLRLKPDAQWEMQQYAQALLDIAKHYYPTTMKIWEELNVKKS